jgi:Uma2 family endonuclease
MPKKSAEPWCRVLYGQTWQDYEYALAERDRLGRRYRVTYDCGVLEIALIDSVRARLRSLLGSLVMVFMVERAVPFGGVGSFTCRRQDLDCGLEPDESYYIQNELLARGRDLDLKRDPPPDLAIEIGSPHSIVDRVGILEALGVPEIWRYGGNTLTVRVRGCDGRRASTETSRALPTLPLEEVRRRMQTWKMTDQTTWLRDWQAWLRGNEAPSLK